jgi:glycosyltransferase involved in cell wall biosynthesis
LTFGVDTKVFHPGYREAAIELRRRLDIPPDATILLSIRGLRPTYGHHLILEAFAQAYPRLNAASILVFKTLAAVESYEAELRRRAEDLGISQSVRWLSHWLTT